MAHVVHVGEKRNADNIFVVKPEAHFKVMNRV